MVKRPKEETSLSHCNNDAEPNKKITKITEAKEKNPAVIYNPVLVPSVPPHLASVKFGLDPEKWRRRSLGRNSYPVFSNSYQIHTRRLDRTQTLYVKADLENYNMKLDFAKKVLEESQVEFKSRIAAAKSKKNMRKYVLSKRVYKRIESYAKEDRQEYAKELKGYEDIMNKNMASYVQYAPKDLSKPLKTGVLLWYKMLQFSKFNSPMSECMEYHTALDLQKLFAQECVDADYKFIMGTLDVLFKSSNLYPLIYDQDVFRKKRITACESYELDRADEITYFQVFDRIMNELEESQEEISEESQKDDEDDEAEGDELIDDTTDKLKEMRGVVEKLKCPGEVNEYDFPSVADYFIRKASQIYAEYLMSQFNAVDSEMIALKEAETDKMLADMRQIFQERKNYMGPQHCMWFIDFFEKVEELSMEFFFHIK